MRKKWSWLAATALLMYAAGVIIHIARHPETYLWDFRIYYAAVQAYAAGLNPYDLGDLHRFSPIPMCPQLNFVYQPLTLYYFYPLRALDFATAYQVFLGAKVIVVAGLFFLWRRWFLDPGHGVLFLFFMVAAFNHTLYTDLAAGNISVFEQLGLWLAMLCFLRGHLALFSLIIALVASIKLVPILFLGLLFLAEDRRQAFACLALGGLGFACLLGISYLSQPFLFHFSLSNSLSLLAERGNINPSTLSFLCGGVQQAGKVLGIGFPAWVVFSVYAAVSGLILAVSAVALKAWLGSGHPDRMRVAILFGCVVYALLAPRFKDYSYILLLVPAFFILWRTEIISASYVFLGLMVFSPHPTLPWLGEAVVRLFPYYCLFLAFLVWAMYLEYIYRQLRLNSRGIPNDQLSSG